VGGVLLFMLVRGGGAGCERKAWCVHAHVRACVDTYMHVNLIKACQP